MFGTGAGSALVTQMLFSSLMRSPSRFQRAILQSGPGSANWASYKPGTPLDPKQIALRLAERLNCTLPQDVSPTTTIPASLARCLRTPSAEDLLAETRRMTVEEYNSSTIFVPVGRDSFGALPNFPSALAADTQNLPKVPVMLGWSTDDSSWVVKDPDDDGVTFDEFSDLLKALLRGGYTPSVSQQMFPEVLATYNLDDPSKLSPLDIRDVACRVATDVKVEAFVVKEARQLSKAAADSNSDKKTYLYQYDYRPSYKTTPMWQGVTHVDERAMVMGLPNGTNPYRYPVTSKDDRKVAEMMTTMWSNFAKYSNPTPQPLAGGVKWPALGNTSDDQQLLVIRPNPVVKQYDRNPIVELWTGSSGLDD
ncbi:carboxylic ester hydrolase [Elysia marginata]|uniref:Carboxylic ester hydrolase n=1 Tax=Elysia marginata TaxID=1093978 RepID=A0AAV4FZV7_9GAST|nr:carboxylic ester hydrolase [Elysia marginata]